MENLLRALQVAEILNLRTPTVYQLAYRGLIPHVRISQGSRRALIRFRREDIEKLIEDRSVSSQAD